MNTNTGSQGIVSVNSNYQKIQNYIICFIDNVIKTSKSAINLQNMLGKLSFIIFSVIFFYN